LQSCPVRIWHGEVTRALQKYNENAKI
jgi:hypothetical protein